MATMKPQTKSPRRLKILEILEGKRLSAAQIGEALGSNREAAYQLLLKMLDSKQVSRHTVKGTKDSVWSWYTPPMVEKKPERFCAGTAGGRLSLSYMQTPVRAGSMDAYAIASKGIGA